MQILWAPSLLLRTRAPSHHMAGRSDTEDGSGPPASRPGLRYSHFGDWKAPAGSRHTPGRFSGRLGSAARRRENNRWLVEKVATSHLKAGFLRKNGVPYSDNTALTEYYDVVTERNGDVLLVVTSVIVDPVYLRESFIVSTHFKKQAGDAGWNPTACSAKW